MLLIWALLWQLGLFQNMGKNLFFKVSSAVKGCTNFERKRVAFSCDSIFRQYLMVQFKVKFSKNLHLGGITYLLKSINEFFNVKLQ